MNFDLNTVQGFSNLTLSNVSTILNSLTGKINQTWDIEEGAYGHNGNNVLFHVFKTSTDFNAAVGQVQDNGGRRKVPIIFPYQDGQSTDDIGRSGDSFDIDVLLFGPKYKAQYKKLLQELNKPEPGTLVHPVRGQLTVAAESWTVTHASDKKQAVALRIRFIEHTFSVSYDTIPIAKDITSALAKAIGFISDIANFVNDIQLNALIPVQIAGLVGLLLSEFNDDYTSVLSNLNQTFNAANASVIPGLQPTVAGQNPNVFSVATSAQNVFSGTAQLQSTQNQVIQQLTGALAAQQAIDQVKALRISLNSTIAQMSATQNGQGALTFYNEILTLKQSIVEIQNVLELGLQSSKNQIVSYTTPKDMSVREVCFANGLTPDNSYSVEVLNPELLSLNLIPKGTMVQIPT